MELRIHSWDSSGLTCPDIKVSLIEGDNQSGVVSIIQMPNGTGKTTTLDLLRASLTGLATNWQASKVMRFRSQSKPDEGYFRVDLSVDEKQLVFEMNFDFTTSQISYITTSPDVGGRRDGWEPPRDIRRFLHSQFVDLIVFDGEFAQDLLDPAKTNAEHAVDAMSQLYLLDRARDFSENEKKRIVSEAGVTGSNQALKQTKNKLEDLNAKIIKIQNTKEKIEQQLQLEKDNEKKLKTTFDDLVAQQEGADNKLSLAKQAVDNAKNSLVQTADNTFSAIRIPSLLSDDFASNLKVLNEGLESIQLPSSSSKQFFIELADSAECVCGRPITSDVRETILVKSKSYLGQEHAGVINSIRTQIQSVVYKDELSDESDKTAQYYETILTDTINKLGVAKTDLGELEAGLASPGGELAKIRDELLEISRDNKKKEEMLDEINRPPKPDDDHKSVCLSALNKQKLTLDRKLEKLTDTVDVGERTRVIQNILSVSKEKSREVIRKRLVKESNEQLSSILEQSPITIEDITSSVKLKNQERGSKGQELAVGYVLLGNLLYQGAHSLPFVVDSPAHNIDNTVRREVSKIIPNLCDQFITFVISSEKGVFTDGLARSSNKVQFMTIFRKLKATDKHLSNLPSKGVIESAGYMLVEDRDFFDSFDIEEQ